MTARNVSVIMDDGRTRNVSIIMYAVKRCMYSRTCYEQPTSYRRPLGHSPKWHFAYKSTLYEQPPALKGHFFCVAMVAAHSRFYCITMYDDKKCKCYNV